jgi:hypothetical protein
MTETTEAEKWAALTRPFDPADLEKLPKNVSRDDKDRGNCVQGSRYSADGTFCGKYHARAVHLDYVGHAGITMRLNDVLGPDGWEFEPFALAADGLPVISQSVFYARLTILGASKWDMAANFNGPQEAYGDALRRCAMRFGIGTYLWSKSDTAAALAAADPAPTLMPGEQLERDLSGLSAPIQQQVRDRWPFFGEAPADLNAAQITEVRALVRTVMAANMETS